MPGAFDPLGTSPLTCLLLKFKKKSVEIIFRGHGFSKVWPFQETDFEKMALEEKAFEKVTFGEKGGFLGYANIHSDFILIKRGKIQCGKTGNVEQNLRINLSTALSQFSG